MNPKIIRSLLTALLSIACAPALNGQSSAFTYQGRLNLNGAPANGIYDLAFSLFSTSSGGSPVPSPFTNNATAISNGLFTVTITSLVDGVFNGSAYWLEISARTNGAASFTTLTPRQEVTHTPYAIFAEGAKATGLIGTLPPTSFSGTYGAAVAMNNANNTFSGSFSGNGANVSNVNAALLGGLTASNFWKLGGNNVAPGQFLGTTNYQPLEFKVNNQRALRLEPTASTDTVNVIGGSSRNFVGAGVAGATIGGGGTGEYQGNAYTNQVGANFGTVSGGAGNTILLNAE